MQRLAQFEAVIFHALGRREQRVLLEVRRHGLEENATVAALVLAEHRGRAGFPERWATTRSQGGTDSYVFSGSRGFRERPRPALTLYASAWDRAGDLARTPGNAPALSTLPASSKSKR